ncbi:hypothetical protein KAU15_06090, partial [candidate division WOR-3 bacterium]|nr:hypothetical protein [candidate division WOR-3 bacterium]
MNMKIVFIILFLIIFSSPIFSIDMGGGVEILTTGYIDDNDDFDYDITESADFEIFLPKLLNHDLRCEFVVYKPIQGLSTNHQTSLFFRKLYIKFKLPLFNLTLGRQPISWSYGSIFNTVDYSLGATALNEESNDKYTDAANIYIPVNWNSGLSLIASFPDGFTTNIDKAKLGARARMGFFGYDITVNYVRETYNAGTGIASFPIFSDLIRQRMGFTFKGDVWDIGLYGAFGYYFNHNISNTYSYLLGADYSFFINSNTKIIIQIEYIGIDLNNIDSYMIESFLNLYDNNKLLNIVTGNISIPIDDFSYSYFNGYNKPDGFCKECNKDIL